MNDQAQGLRNLVQGLRPGGGKSTRVITVTSGKGGVGKSNFTLNFALTLQSRGYKVLIFDADIGLANIDVLMGESPKYSLYHLLKREKSIWDIIHHTQSGLMFIAGGSGFHDLLKLTEEELEHFVHEVNKLNGHVDYILFDTGAGLSKETLKFIVAAEETFVVTTPEPTSITDAYAIIKMVSGMDFDVDFRLIINRISDKREGKQTADKITMVAKQFLDVDIATLGYVYDDTHVTKAVKRQIPFTLAYPNSAASKAVYDVVNRFLSGKQSGQDEGGGIRSFLSRMVRLIH